MTLNLKIFLSIVVFLLLAVIVVLLKKGTLKIKYSMLWFLLAIVLVVVLFVPNLISTISEFCGFDLTSNFVFFITIAFAFVILVSLFVIISKQAEKIKSLIQQLGVLEKRVRELEDKEEK